MVYEVVFTATARRDMQRVPPRIVPAMIEFAYGELSRNPRKVGKPLERELVGRYSARRGPYRIVYSINEDRIVVEILRVAHRADVYRPR